eukprot:GHUV01003464.1.p1 GENE.GHUV01003464.1~~GHUV01003464.1.p1  ORF type:complete len:560 (+),score=138.66 GHUV01003464.1:1567-3246(+)
MLRTCLLLSGTTVRGQVSASRSPYELLCYIANQLGRTNARHAAAASTLCSFSSSTANRQQDGRLQGYLEPLSTQSRHKIIKAFLRHILGNGFPQGAHNRHICSEQQSSIGPQLNLHSRAAAASNDLRTLVAYADRRTHCSLPSKPYPQADARHHTRLLLHQSAVLSNSSSWCMARPSLSTCLPQAVRHMHHNSAVSQASHVDYDSSVDTDTEQSSSSSSAAALTSEQSPQQQQQQPWQQEPGHQQQQLQRDARVNQQWRHMLVALTQPHQQQQEFPVYACHLAAEIDIQQFVAKNQMYIKDKYPSTKDNVMIEAAIESDDVVFMGERSNQSQPGKQIMVVYKYGSVVFFNMRKGTIDKWRERLQPFMHQKSMKEFKVWNEEAKLVIDPGLDSWSRLEPDKIVVQTLDAANARVISNVLGQSVALDSYNVKVDDAIHQFTPYLSKVAEEGESSDIKDMELLKLIADNSLLYTDVVTKIGLLDISQTAWTQDKYHDLWTALRKDYELDRRFDAINRKLGPLIENAKFLLELRAEQKSSDAEKIIIVLIMLEVLLGLLKMVF